MSKKHAAAAAAGDDGLAAVSAPWRELLVVCRKCGKKIGRGGFGPDGRETLPDALKQVLRARRRRRDVRLLETGCLGICPKNAVMLMRGDAPGDMLAVRAGTDMAALADRLGLAAQRTEPGSGTPPSVAPTTPPAA